MSQRAPERRNAGWAALALIWVLGLPALAFPFLQGDVNEDEVFNVLDGVVLRRALAGLGPGMTQQCMDTGEEPPPSGMGEIMVPFQQPPSPATLGLPFDTQIQKLDLYLMLDRSGSMSAESTALRSALTTVVSNLTCAPLGSGEPGACVPELWTGSGSIGYVGPGGEPYTNHLDVQADPAAAALAIPTAEPAGCCDEPLYLGLWSALTGMGSTASGCPVSDAYPDRGPCPVGTGYPCFRPGALRVVVLATDEAPSLTTNCPLASTVATAANAIGAKLVGIDSSAGNATVRNDLRWLALATGTVDVAGTPLVLAGRDAAAPQALQSALGSLITGVPMVMTLVIRDDPSDSVDAVAAFVDHVVTTPLGTPECSSGFPDLDADEDTFPETYLGVPTGTPLCWQIVPRVNMSVAETTVEQEFRVIAEVRGGSESPPKVLLGQQVISFIVPAAP